MATDIIARGMAAGAAKSVNQIREELKSKSDKSWTGTKAEWEVLDKSTLENGQQINITDDAEPIEIQQIAVQVAQDKTAAETAAATCESISQMMSDYASPLCIKPTVEGSDITIEDSGNAPIQGLTVYGKSTQVMTSGVQLLDKLDDSSSYGDYCTYNDDGSITIHNTRQSTPIYPAFIRDTDVVAGKYTLSYVADDNVKIYLQNAIDDYTKKGSSTSGSITHTITDYLAVMIVVQAGEKITVKLMLTAGDTAHTYEPYTGGQPSPSPDYPQSIVSVDNPTITISDNADSTQSATIPYALRGIPVSSGGNYTDSTGQQWVCDTLTVNADGSGELIQRVGSELTSDANAFALPNVDNIFTIKKSTTGYLQGKASLTQYRVLCSHFSTSEKRYASPSSPNNSITWSGEPDQQLRVVSTMGIDALNELFNSGNVVLQYILAAPVTTALSPEEVQSILALQTYKPLTNISNDKSADMSVTYVADSKTYIDNKFAEVSAAIISSASEEE